jgi:hypothetical protein
MKRAARVAINLLLVLGSHPLSIGAPPDGKGKQAAPTPLGVYDGTGLFLGPLVQIYSGDMGFIVMEPA